MIIGSEFSKKYQRLLIKLARLSGGNTKEKISVKDINEGLELDRTEIRNILEYLEELGYIKTVTIGGPLLYGDVSITKDGLKRVAEF